MKVATIYVLILLILSYFRNDFALDDFIMGGSREYFNVCSGYWCSGISIISLL